MADTDDVQKYQSKFENQRRLLEESDIDERDKEAIKEFVRHEDGSGSNMGVLVSYLNRLRLSSKRADVPLVDMEESDIDDLLFSLKHDHGIQEGTRRNYRKALRKLFDYLDRDWEVTVGSPVDRTVDPDQLLEREEIDDIIDTATVPRDKAAVALLADTGMRIGAVASLRIKDIDLSGELATVTVNENGNVKGASGSIPLTWSRGYIANWLDVHPRRDNPNAAFIHKLRQVDEDEDGALTYQYLSRRIREIGVEAGIQEERLNMHNFRKSAISRWIRQGMDEQKIKHRAFWVKDSSQFETYSGVTEDEMNRDIAEHYGLSTGDDEGPDMTLEECPTCRTPLRGSERFCPSCGSPLSQSAADEIDEAEEALFETAKNNDGELTDEELSILRSVLDEHAAQEAIAENDG